MPTQTSFSELEYAAKKKLTRRDRFLAEIEAVTPWRERVAVIEPHYPKGSRGRPPIGPERMLRMKAHVGVDAESGLVHTVVGTAANVSDVTQAHALLHGEETDVFADAGYRGVDMRDDVQRRHPSVRWHVAMMPGKRRVLPKDSPLGAILEQLEQTKARIRATSEHALHVLKNSFRYRKTRYRGLAKNTHHLHTLFGLANLVLARRWSGASQGQSAC